MTKAIIGHIEFLRREFRCYSESAKFLRVAPRSYRHQRQFMQMSNSARRSIVLAAKYIQLRKTIRILREDYGVPAADIRAACRKAKFN